MRAFAQTDRFVSEVQARMRTARLPEPLVQRLVVGR